VFQTQYSEESVWEMPEAKVMVWVRVVRVSVRCTSSLRDPFMHVYNAYSGRAYMYTPALVGVTTLQRFGLELGLTTATSMVFVVLVLNSRL